MWDGSGAVSTLAMRFTDALIGADQRGERNGFGRGKSGIPSGAMLHRLDGLAIGILIFIRRSLPNKLLVGLWMLALAEFREVLGGDGSGKAELRGQAALPTASPHTPVPSDQGFRSPRREHQAPRRRRRS